MGEQGRIGLWKARRCICYDCKQQASICGPSATTSLAAQSLPLPLQMRGIVRISASGLHEHADLGISERMHVGTELSGRWRLLVPAWPQMTPKVSSSLELHQAEAYGAADLLSLSCPNNNIQQAILARAMWTQIHSCSQMPWLAPHVHVTYLH